MKFTWYGKENAIIESMTPSTGTLRPDKDSSKNWDDTDNLYIEGDNLEVLKLLQKSYFGKVKMIYIDPPYNTGNDFIYPDNFRDNITNYKEITNQTTKANPETNGRYHTDWLNMMYPRLKLAKNLLSDDGLIFVSLDQNESTNFKKICDEVFGEKNFISQITVVSNPGGRDYGGVAIMHDYVFVYKKSENTSINLIHDKEKKFKLFDNIGGFELRELRNRNIKFNKDNRPNLYYPFYINEEVVDDNGLFEISLEKREGWYELFPLESQGIKTVWRWGKSRALENLNINIKAKKMKKGSYQIVEKYREEKTMARSVWWDKDINTEKGTLLIKQLFEGKFFDYPKPLEMIKRICEMGTDKDDIVLDFFSGSATTAHAVMQMNVEDGGNRKFIMVQLPEETDEKNEAYKAGYKNICEIGKERIRRAGDKMVSENKDKEGIENLDIGFKVFKLEYNCGGENHSMIEEGIKVDIIKKPKDKPICKFKVYGELYYLVKTNEDVIVFPYKSGIKGKVIASIFNIELCKNKDYMQLEYLYNMKLNEFNGEDFVHSQYVTSVILDNVYKNLND